MDRLNLNRHPGEDQDLSGAFERDDEIPAFAGMTDEGAFQFSASAH
ncbi:hypothetical protein [Sphingopyxis soli]|nr:hypothetical protein [Sphingopyxis soli]